MSAGGTEYPIAQRYWAWGACVLLAAFFAAMAVVSPMWAVPAIVFTFLALVGLWDFTQSRQAIRRNYPVIAHLRFFFEYIRPEIRQYFLESEREESPFSRAQRSIVYQRAKGVIDKRPYGTQLDLYEAHYEWINHSIAPADIASHDFRIDIGEGRSGEAVFGERLQHLRDELRRAFGQRGPRA